MIKIYVKPGNLTYLMHMADAFAKKSRAESLDLIHLFKAEVKNTMKKLCMWIFLLIIFMPITLGQIKSHTDIKFDVSLRGYTNSVEKPNLSLDTFLDGTFQSGYGTWFEENMPLRGVLTKTYNTIRYNAFYLGNRPIGSNGSIYEPAYLYAELAIGAYDYSIPENAEKLQDMVDHMNSVSNKLRQIDKYLYVYIAPSKADFCPEDMPDNYVALSEPGAVNVTDLFREKISTTTVPYMICSDMADELEYPAFYPTGIHWSRTYEQLASQKIINDLCALSGKIYRNIDIQGDAESRKIPFWRDSDVYNLLNVWVSPDIDYYQYTVKATESKSAEALKMLLVGDSFAEGLKKDIKENIKEDTIILVNRNQFVIDQTETRHSIDGNWDNFDWQSYLDRVDFVVIEITEPLITEYTYDFIDYLDSYLDGYVPRRTGVHYVAELDGNNEATWDLSSSIGVWDRQKGYAWIKPDCRIALSNKSISDNGLEIDFNVPLEAVDTGEPERVEITINGSVVYEATYTSPAEEKIIIKPNGFLRDENDDYIVTISCSNYFNPYVRGINSDNRDLALVLKYIGGAR